MMLLFLEKLAQVILECHSCILVTIISLKVTGKNYSDINYLECRSFGLTYSGLTSPPKTTPKMKNKQTKKLIIIIEKL